MQKREKRKKIMKCSAGVPRFHMVQCFLGGQQGGGGGGGRDKYIPNDAGVSVHQNQCSTKYEYKFTPQIQ